MPKRAKRKKIGESVPEPFEEEDVPFLIQDVGNDASATARDDLTAALRQLVAKEIRKHVGESRRAGELTKTGIPHVVMRTKSLGLLFASFAEMATEAQFSNELRIIGMRTGLSFGSDLFRHFLRIERYPADYQAFLSFWENYDSSAGWGKYYVEPDLTPPSFGLSVRVEDSFLVNARKDVTYLGKERPQSHQYCSWMAGYLEGLMRFGFLGTARLLKDNLRVLPEPSVTLRAVSSVEKHRGNSCVFVVELRQETDEQSFDILWSAWRGEPQARALQFRNAMESGIRRRLGVETKSRGSFYKMLRAISTRTSLTGQNWTHAANDYRNLYSFLSEQLHIGAISSAVDDVFHLVMDFLYDLEDLKMSKELLEQILKEISEEKDSEQ